jgi:hypothetical protein
MTAMHAFNASSAQKHVQHIPFDTDSTLFLINTGSSYHIWTDHRHFQDYEPLTELEKQSEQVLRIDSLTTAPEGKGTVPFSLEDDEGKLHTFLLQDVRYLPNSPINIMVPQLFAKQCRSEGDPIAHCDVQDEGMLLEWAGDDGNKASKFVPLTGTNVGITRTAPSFHTFTAFAAIFQDFAFLATTISDDEGADNVQDTDNECSTNQPPSDLPPPKPPPDNNSATHTTAVPTDFSIKRPPAKIENEQDQPLMVSDARLMMEYHERLGHISFEQLRILAHNGLNPK